MQATTSKNSEGKGKSFGKKLALLIISFVIAIGLWYLCTVRDEKMISKKYSDIPVVFTNETILSESNLAAKTVNGVTVSVILKGPISELHDIDPENLVAEFDLSKVSSAGDFKSVPVVVGLPENVTASADSVNVQIEEIIRKSLPIDVEIRGVPAAGFSVREENIVLGDRLVEAACGKSFSKNVASAKVVVDVTGRSSNYSVSLNVVLLNTVGEEISSNNVKLDKNSVTVSVTVVEE